MKKMTAIAIPRPIEIPNGIKWLGFLGVVFLVVSSPTLDLINVTTASDEAKDLLSLADETVVSKDGTMTFQVVRSSGGQGLIAYDFKTGDGSAGDYEDLSGSAWISSDETNDHVVIITNDAVMAPTEIFTFEIFNIRFLE